MECNFTDPNVLIFYENGLLQKQDHFRPLFHFLLIYSGT